MRNYEMVFILSPELDEEKLGATVEKVTNLINNNGGEVVKQDNWGKKHLAYEIKDRHEGYYYLVEFKGTPATAKELDRVLKITEEVLRFLIVRKED
ncbi:MAG TPA: 30S ribosomal protein S6 [Peptococcaceae bacterium]|mgnify:CR=1 FL=1|jgi:small subunit ribosomal protein S6|nr:30S ribosomal protein S6 [Clostridia bacterium]HOB81667.1 30S ribosomal protein S6 [Peptococcaceae bacterium]HQD54786.1 30S ribosomal protein S6 [Peptococcaceae bacterium]